MAKLVPFTVHVRIIPTRHGKRWEYLRDLQKLAVLAYDSIISIAGVQVATPGGGQSTQMSDINRRGGFGSYADGMAIKPQIGASPAQLMITGFYESTENNEQRWTDFQRFSGGETYTGSSAHAHDSVQTSTIMAEVKALKTALNNAITSGIPAGVTFSIFRLEYAGVIYGDEGVHFPR